METAQETEGRRPPSGTRGTIEWLVEIMRRLLAEGGCPWDREQTLESLRPFLLEEAYEVLDALDEGDRAHHAEELGDLLFQILFQSALAGIGVDEVITSIGEKLIRRHPHVFGGASVDSSAMVIENWERIKKGEREKKGEAGRGPGGGVLGGVPRSMPALARAHKLTSKAARVGFDWPDLPSVRAKVSEELGELDAALGAWAGPGGADDAPRRAALQHELGDLLFATVNLARKLGLDPEAALRLTGERFERRFAHVEARLAEAGRAPAGSSLAEMDALWDEAKALERGGDGGDGEDGGHR
jgi:MazG family protein